MNDNYHSVPAQMPRRESSFVGPASLLIMMAAMIGLLVILAATGTSPSPLTWYLARASGFTLYLLFWLSIASGLALTTKLLDGLGGRSAWWQIHGLATDLAFAFLGVHMLSLAVDPAEPLGFSGVLFPFMSDVRQPWTDVGILTAWGMVLIATSFSLRRFIGAFGWRLLHYGSFPLWIMALVHGLGSGSDTTRLWAVLVYAVTTAIVIFLVLFRVLTTVSHGAQVDAPPLASIHTMNTMDETHRERA